MSSVWDDIPEEDRGFLADWYETIDRVGYTGQPVDQGRSADPGVVQAQEQAATDARKSFEEQLELGLLTSADLDRIQPPTPLITDVLFLDTLAWLIGEPANGKSFIALDWAGHVGSGLPWCGYPTAQGTVIYCSPESPGGVRLRVRAWEAAMGHEMANVLFLPIPVQAGVEGHWQALIRVAARRNPSLIIFDTQARMTVGMEENSAADMGEWVDKLERLRAVTKACVLVVHHKTRGAKNMRGSTALEGAASTIINSEKDGNEIILSADPKNGGKTKDCEPFTDITLRLVPSGESVVPVPQGGVAQPDSDITPAVRSALALWWEEHETDLLSPTAIVKEQGGAYFSKSTFYRLAKKLVRQGLLEEGGTRTRRLYALTRQP